MSEGARGGSFPHLDGDGGGGRGGGFPNLDGGGGVGRGASGGGSGFPSTSNWGRGGGFPNLDGGGGVGRGASGGGSGFPSASNWGGAPEMADGSSKIGNGCTPKPIFAGMRILLVGFGPRARKELQSKITGRGGLVLRSPDYELYTHICVEGETHNSDKRIITKDWIKVCCDFNMKLEVDNVTSEPDEIKRAMLSDKMRLLNRSTARRIFYFEERDMILHELFVCEADKSQKITLEEYVQKRKDLRVTEISTPGGFRHKSISTASEVKGLVREIYIVLRSLHRAGFSLWGHFSMQNFVIDDTKMRMTIKLANLPKSLLQNVQPDGERLDLEHFVSMVKDEVLKGLFPPHDITLWLSMVGETGMEDLVPSSCLVMDLQEYSDCFTDCYDIFLDLDSAKQEKICKALEALEIYNGWIQKIVPQEGNELLRETFENGSYEDTVEDLLRLLRNSRQHSSRYKHSQFCLIVGNNFPNLISDFQKELYKGGFLKGLLK